MSFSSAPRPEEPSMSDQPEYADETERMQCEADAQAEAAYASGRADEKRLAGHELERLRHDVERLQALLGHAEQYARDLQDGTAPGLADVYDPERPDRLENAFQVLFDLVEKYGGERMQEQQEMWGQIENAFEELAEAGIAEGRRQAANDAYGIEPSDLGDGYQELELAHGRWYALDELGVRVMVSLQRP